MHSISMFIVIVHFTLILTSPENLSIHLVPRILIQKKQLSFRKLIRHCGWTCDMYLNLLYRFFSFLLLLYNLPNIY